MAEENIESNQADEALVVAKVHGEAVTEIPQDLYIPPDALEVFLETFEGPLDLLLYLIKRQNIDITEIRIAEITSQYMEYISLMHATRLELAAEYLLMAAMLGEIKSRLLLPKPQFVDEDEVDPRADLIRRLQEYERFKQAAEDIDELPRMERDISQPTVELPELTHDIPLPDTTLKELLLSLANVMKRAEMRASHQIAREPLSVRERMSIILGRLQDNEFVTFYSCFRLEEGRSGVVVTFLAVLELVKESLIDIIQPELFGPIHVKARPQLAVDGGEQSLEREKSA